MHWIWLYVILYTISLNSRYRSLIWISCMYNCHMIIFFKPNMASLHISIHVKFKKLKNRKNYNEDRTSLSLIICRGIIYHVFYMYFIFKSYLTCTQVYSYPLYYSKKIKSYHFSKKKKIKKICFLNMVSLFFFGRN